MVKVIIIKVRGMVRVRVGLSDESGNSDGEPLGSENSDSEPLGSENSDQKPRNFPTLL